jgi:NADH:ubiquinone oxidoreductase subunit E
MGGVDTRDRYHVHWGAAEQYAERREESALRRSGRTVPDRSFDPFEPIDLEPLDEILAAAGHKPANALAILEGTQGAYGHLPVAALQHIAHQTGANYSQLYGIATSYPHLHFEPPVGHIVRVCRCTSCTLLGGGRVLAAFREHLGTDVGGVSPDGIVRLATTECGGSAEGSAYVEVDGEPLPKSSPEDAAVIAAALRGDVPQGAVA